ncbi:LysM peptidoglycan-binding domain-containing protein [Pseudorhodoferax soli]|uniref:LysM domain-containing protein n=1 Tax=Pseudorhodoferax soli TaxID=545864 RepID=A0A368Y646_9BURK|nr:LysM peptidoglycan-binding domain-containing protein [Pseudorhodoferax soli]RCW75753.1 LysM domain-containing protein [Pseudorhodoferax soli]
MPKPSLVFVAVLVLLAGCAAPPSPAPAPVPTMPAAPPPPPEPEPPPPRAPQRPATAAEAAQAQKIARAVIDLLEAGKEDEARAELERALALDFNNKLAVNLMRQITMDPAELGRESFNYTVRPSDTLSRIAQRFLNDLYAFYILARYNGLSVPKQISSGQVLRIPGRPPAGGTAAAPEPTARPPAPAPSRAAPAPAPPPAPAEPPAAAPAPVPQPPAAPAPAPEPSPGEQALRSAEAAERAGQAERALAEYERAAALDQPGAKARADAARKRLVERHSLAARSAFARQDLAGAIRGWDRVLELEPANETARLERQKAQQLQERADKLK